MGNNFDFSHIAVSCSISMPTAQPILIVIVLSIAYILGSIPFGLILTKTFLKKDIRKIGSGNIGATNVLRTGNKILAFLTLLFDALKGFSIFFYLKAVDSQFIVLNLKPSGCPQFRSEKFVNEYNSGLEDIYFLGIIAGLFVILGHCFPVWLKFKGGKGVSTALGVLLAAVPYAGLGAALIWIGTLLVFRISSLSALVACAAAPIITLFIYGAMPAAIVLLISLLITYRHKDNIKRLLKGEEPKVGKKNA